MKTRLHSIQTGNQGVNAVRNYCEANNLIFQGEPAEDYGVDCYIEVSQDNSPLNFLVSIQVKAGLSYQRTRKDGSFTVSVSSDDMAYWLAANVPVIFVYVDLEHQHLYWKHVQAEVDLSNPTVEIPRHFEFSPASTSDSLADYLRKLRTLTPQPADVVHVAKGNPSIIVDEHVYRLDKLETHLFNYPANDEFVNNYTTVIGFSRGERWVVLREVVGSPRGQESYIIFLDLNDWRKSRLPVSVFDSEPDCAENIAVARRVLARLDCVAPRRLLYRHDFVRSSLNYSIPSVGLQWGEHGFSINVTAENYLHGLVLKSLRFPRLNSAILLSMEQTPQILILEDLNPISEVQQFLGICEIVVSPNGTIISIGAATNPEHMCFGESTIHHLHLRVEELRRRCIGLLRVGAI